jgi:antitoxin FitA
VGALSIRDLDDGVKERLRVRAAQNGRSMEAEARLILAEAVDAPGRSSGLFGALFDHVSGLGGVELVMPARTELPRAPDQTT